GGDGDRGGGDVAVARLHGQARGDRVETDVHDGELQAEVRGDRTHQFDVEAGVLARVVGVLVLHRRVGGVGAHRQDPFADGLEVGGGSAVAVGLGRVGFGAVSGSGRLSVAAATGRQDQCQDSEERYQAVQLHRSFLHG